MSRGRGPSRAAQLAATARLRQAEAAAAEQRVARRRRGVLAAVVGVLVAAVIAGVGGYQYWAATATPDLTRAVAVAPGETLALRDGQPLAFGTGGRRVEVFEDAHCSHCADFERTFGPTLDAALAAGRITLVVYPMAFIDAGSRRAAAGLGCAAEQAFGLRFRTAVVDNPARQWTTGQVLAAGRQLGGDRSADFAACVRTGASDAWVASVGAAAQARGVTQIPTLVVDGSPVDIPGLTVDTLVRRLA